MVKASTNTNLPSIIKKWVSSSILNENISLSKSIDALKKKKVNFIDLKTFEEFLENNKYEVDLEKTKIKHLLGGGLGFDKTGETMRFGGFAELQ
jgi:hypothetical protein